MDITSPQSILFAVIAILISLTIHEFMHAFVGYQLGDTTASASGRLSLNPLHHIDPIMTIALPIITLIIFKAPILAAKPVPFDPDRVAYGEFGPALIAAAGPLSNLVLAILSGLVVNHVALGVDLNNFLVIFTELNVALFVFNLIPIPPLDGSRVLYVFAPEPLQNFMRQLEPIGFYIVFGLVLIGGFGNVINDLNNTVLNLLP